jgi:hypothetical protein
MPLSRHDIENRFMFHPVEQDHVRARLHESTRETIKTAAHKLNNTLPDGHERNLAIDALDAALMWANAAIARQR